MAGYNEKVTGAIGFRGDLPIGRVNIIKGYRPWQVEIFFKGAVAVPSLREAREILATHGADGVDLRYQVERIWPAELLGVPDAMTGQPRENLPICKKIYAPGSVWDRRWVRAF